jgi:hypothetical protein
MNKEKKMQNAELRNRFAFCILHFAFCIFLVPTAQADQFALFITGGKSITTWHGQADLQSVAFEYTRSRSPRTDLGVAVAPQVLWQPRSWFGNLFGDGNETVRAVTASIVVRRRFFTNSSRLQPYIEGSIGPMWADKAIPAATSRFNVATEPGAGVVLWPRSRHPLIIGYRFSHLSNGGYSPRNPGLNVSSLVLGVAARRILPASASSP